MNNFIKQVIEEKFASKSQQRFFYAKANEKGKSKKEKQKWGKWAKEFSDKTDYEKIPDKVESDNQESQFDEIVDKNGNIQRSKKNPNFNTKGITQDKTSDEVALAATGQMGSYGGSGAQPYRRYWGESDMSKSLGYKKTLGNDEDLEDAEEYFEKELGMGDSEAEDRLNAMGYDSDLPEDKVRLVENPKKYVEDFIESIVKGKTKSNDILPKENEISPIVKKQIKSLKNTMDSHNLSIDDIIKHLKGNE